MTSVLPHRIGLADSDWTALVVDWLAGLYLAAPTAETIDSFRDGPGTELLDSITQQPECHSSATRMRTFLTAGDTSAEVALQLSVAFTQLFVGLSGPRTVSLYESAYSDAGRLFQAATSDLDALLRRFDVAIVPTVQEPADHIAIELALLARIVRRGDVLSEASLLDDHLIPFASRFASQCLENDRSGFYAAASDVLVGFLHARRQALRIGPDGFDLLVNDADAGTLPGTQFRFGAAL